MRPAARWAVPLTAILAIAACPRSGEAQTTANWINAGNGAYSDPANWSPADVPGDGCCGDETARFNLAGTRVVEVASGAPLTPLDLEFLDGATTLGAPLPGPQAATLSVANDIVVNSAEVTVGGAQVSGLALSAGQQASIDNNGTVSVLAGGSFSAPSTVIGAGPDSDTELRFEDDSTGDLGFVVVGQTATAGRDSLLSLFNDAGVLTGSIEIGPSGLAGQTAAVQVFRGELTQAADAAITVGTDGGAGVAILAAAIDGVIRTGAGGVNVLADGRIVNNAAIHFGGDVTLSGGPLSYREAPGSAATRSFAPASTISLADGAIATFDTTPLEFDDAQTLAVAGPTGKLDAAGPISFGSGSSLELRLGATPNAGGLIASDGQVALAGVLRVTLANGASPEAGTSFPLISADGGFSGGFEEVFLPPIAGISWQFDNDGQALTLTAAAAEPGDYNSDGIVSAADFTVWRDTLGSTTDLKADGDGDGEVGLGDYALWRTEMLAAGTAAARVPEPASGAAILCVCAAIHAATRLPAARSAGVLAG